MTEELVWFEELKVMHAQTDWGYRTVKCKHKATQHSTYRAVKCKHTVTQDSTFNAPVENG